MGPTAAGKTDLAVELVRRYPFEIISVDSAMVYRGMDIGTAKPGAEILQTAPHRLIDILDPAEAYSAARFRADARREIEDIRRAGRWPLLVGGTMLYFRALERGLANLPDADAGVRQRLEAEAQAYGWSALHARLASVDPQAAARIHPNDPQRIQRALEVFELTDRTLSALLADSGEGGLPMLKITLAPPDREVLHARIEQRFHGMLAAGLVAEVQRLFAREDLGPDLPSIRAVGYRQVWNYLQGTLSYEEMIERAIYATRQFAKRQLTWLRGEPELHWVRPESGDIFDSVDKILDSALPIGDLDK